MVAVLRELEKYYGIGIIRMGININREKLLLELKRKIDRRMENNPPDSLLYEDYKINEVGRYTPQVLDASVVNWTRSFLTGAVAYLYFHFKEDKYLDYLKKSMPVFEDYIYSGLKRAHHDDGFRMSLSVVALYKLCPDECYKKLALRAADELAKCYVPAVGVLPGFFGHCGEERVQTIVDDMMNIGIWMWAGEETQNSFYKELYTTHIKTVMRDMKRPDHSLCHSFMWDGKTGEPLAELNYCGYGVGSTWSRGQAWALYGLVNALKVTGDEQFYLPHIEGQLNLLFYHLKQYPIPKWDLNCFGEETDIWDTSAAAIITCALLKLKELPVRGAMGGIAKNYQEKADEIFECLVRDYWAMPEKDNIIEGGQTGDKMAGCVWGDYFFVEALMRKIYGNTLPDFWV